MFKYILRRILESVPTLFIIVTVSFFLMRLAPGSPFTAERAYPPEIIANIEAKYHLNEPLWKQYAIYLNQLLHGDLGPSFKYKDFTVNQLVDQSFAASFKLGSIAYVFVLIGGVTVGVLAALYQNTIIDYSTIGLLVVGSVIPTIVAAPLLIYVFAVKLQWVPSGGWNGGAWANMALPIVVYVYGSMTFIARITRGNMIEVLHNNYIRTAKAKGLSTRYIIWKHASRAVAVPVVQVLTLAFAGFITGSVIIEQIFGIPGIGQLYVAGAQNRDYGLTLSLTILFGVIILIVNIVNDILTAMVDPRVKF